MIYRNNTVIVAMEKIYEIGEVLCKGSASDLYEASVSKEGALSMTPTTTITTDSSADYIRIINEQRYETRQGSLSRSGSTVSRDASPEVNRLRGRETLLGRYDSQLSMTNGKVIKLVRERRHSKRLYREFDIMIELEHPNILRPDNVIYFPGKGLGMLMPRVRGSDLMMLMMLVESIQPTILFSICRAITRAIDYLHTQCYVHGDLRLENVLVEYTDIAWFSTAKSNFTPRVLLCDFEYAHRMREPANAVTRKHFYAGGAMPCASAELWLNIPFNAYANDVWLVGVVCASILTGVMVLSTGGLGELMELKVFNYAVYATFQIDRRAERTWWKERKFMSTERYRKLPKKYKRMIRKCLQFDEDRRASAHEIAALIE